MKRFFVLCTVFLVLIFSSTCPGQNMTAGQASAENLLNAFASDDDSARFESLQLLTQVGPIILPKAQKMLRSKKGYAQVYSARLILNLRPNDKTTIASLSEIVRDRNEQKEVRRYATYVLALSANGVDELPKLLADKDAFVRRSSAFALLELLENGSFLPKSLVAPLLLAVDSLVQSLGDDDKVVQGVAAEALVQILNDEIPSLNEAAKSSNSQLKNAAKGVIKRRANVNKPEGLDADAKQGFEEKADTSPTLLHGSLGIIRALRMGGEPVRDYRSKRDGDSRILHMVLNPRTRKLSSRLNDFNPYEDLQP